MHSSSLNIISKSWIGLIISTIIFVLGVGFGNLLALFLGILLFIFSLNYGKKTILKLEEEKAWNEKFDGRLFFIFATKKKVQEFILANCIPKDCEELVLLYYDGPKIITQHGQISKYGLGNIYRNHHQMKIHHLSDGIFKEIEYLGNASYEIENPLEIKKKIREIYNKYYS